MTFHEKIRRRVAELQLNKAKAARDVGLPESTISNYLSKVESLPRIDIAQKIAVALKVPLDWLADESRGWPPPPPGQTQPLLSEAPYTELARELARRFRLELLDAIDVMDFAEKENWKAAESAVAALAPGQPPPPSAMRLFRMMKQLIDNVLTILGRYDVPLVADFMHDQLPGRDRPLESLQHRAVLLRYLELIKRVEYRSLAKWASEHSDLLKEQGLFNANNLIGDWMLQVLDEEQRGKLLSSLLDKKKQGWRPAPPVGASPPARATRTINIQNDAAEKPKRQPTARRGRKRVVGFEGEGFTEA